MSGREVTVFEVAFHVDDDSPAANGGAFGDGSYVRRFRNRKDAETCAAGQFYYGKPARVVENRVPVRLARRWGCA